MKRVGLSLLIGFLTLFADTNVLKTGQTMVYQTGDDGTYQRGVARNYAREKSIVTDKATGLMWQDYVKSSLMHWSNAGTYCSSLSLGGHRDWRLPALEELKTLGDRSRNNRAIHSVFQHMTSQNYWSATPFVGDASSAWGVDFLDGYDHIDKASVQYAVRCVRGAFLPAHHYTRNSERETVYDSSTNLAWQDNAHGSLQTFTWRNAIEYCENLTFAGVDDWRLPQYNELSALIDFNRTNPAIYAPFEHTASSDYWSSTTFGGASPDVTESSDAWTIHFKQGDNNVVNKSNHHYVRCVRDGKRE